MAVKFEAEAHRLRADLRSQEIDRRQFVNGCLRLVCHEVGSTRAGLWVLRDPQGTEPQYAQAGGAEDAGVLHCLGIYDRRLDQVLLIHEKVTEGTGHFLQALRGTGHVLAHDASTHPATRDFYDLTLRPKNIRSLIASRFGVNGQIYGALICVNVETPVEWSPRQLAVLSGASSRLTFALAAANGQGIDSLFARL